jgi:hypothetical protein
LSAIANNAEHNQNSRRHNFVKQATAHKKSLSRNLTLSMVATVGKFALLELKLEIVETTAQKYQVKIGLKLFWFFEGNQKGVMI